MYLYSKFIQHFSVLSLFFSFSKASSHGYVPLGLTPNNTSIVVPTLIEDVNSYRLTSFLGLFSYNICIFSKCSDF